MFFGYIDMASPSWRFKLDPTDGDGPAVIERRAAKGLVDDGLQVLDQVVGRRLVIVQFVHLAQELVLAQAEAVIRQAARSRSRSCAGG